MPEGHFYVAHSSCGGILRWGYCWPGCGGVSGTSAKLENNPIINIAGTRTVILFFQWPCHPDHLFWGEICSIEITLVDGDIMCSIAGYIGSSQNQNHTLSLWKICNISADPGCHGDGRPICSNIVCWHLVYMLGQTTASSKIVEFIQAN